jgi:hypothetical protein
LIGLAGSAHDRSAGTRKASPAAAACHRLAAMPSPIVRETIKQLKERRALLR